MSDRLTSLGPFGWDGAWEETLRAEDTGPDVARVITQGRDRWDLHTSRGPGVGRLISSAPVLPVVGDWVVIVPGPAPSDPWTITRVLPRRSRFSRAAAGEGSSEQVVAANVDRVWIVHGLDITPNIRRLERYLAVAWQSGATPEIILTKADLAADLPAATAEVQQVALGVPVRVVSSMDPVAVGTLRSTLEAGRTVVLLGPSGVGKSTLLNALAGSELAETGAVREKDRKGRHTTTRRELFQVDGGALLLDTPGIRELRIWDVDAGIDQAFPDIDELAQSCKFRDCRHANEPGCSVLAAVEAGKLDAARLESFRKLQAEAAWITRKDDPVARIAAASFAKTTMKTLKQHPKYRKEGPG